MEFSTFCGELILVFNQHKSTVGGFEGEIGHVQIGFSDTVADICKNVCRWDRGKGCSWTKSRDARDDSEETETFDEHTALDINACWLNAKYLELCWNVAQPFCFRFERSSGATCVSNEGVDVYRTRMGCIRTVPRMLLPYGAMGLRVRINRPIDSSEDSAKCGPIVPQANKVLITY
jgi:hypothetical protein